MVGAGGGESMNEIYIIQEQILGKKKKYMVTKFKSKKIKMLCIFSP